MMFQQLRGEKRESNSETGEKEALDSAISIWAENNENNSGSNSSNYHFDKKGRSGW